VTDEEVYFEVWFQLHRAKTFARGAKPGDKLENHPHWGYGYRNAHLEGWMARASDDYHRDLRDEAAGRIAQLEREKDMFWAAGQAKDRELDAADARIATLEAALRKARDRISPLPVRDWVMEEIDAALGSSEGSDAEIKS
jgi:hypothetical protein